jgi:hypothetical protein
VSLHEVERHKSQLGVKRIYYHDDEGRLVERLISGGEQHDVTMQVNAHKRDEFKQGQDVVQIASVPPDLFLKWLMDDGVPGYCDDETIDYVVAKKLRDPNYKYLLTVPESYRF